MSLRAMLWALEHAPVTNPARLVVLLALADCAKDDGTAAWPTQERLAERSRCSTRSVRRYLKDLEEIDGVIRRGDQELVAHLRRDQRPVVWDLAMDVAATGQIGRPSSTTTGQSVPPVGSNDRTARAERPDRAGQNDRTLLSTEQSFSPYGRETVLELSNAGAPADDQPADTSITEDRRLAEMNPDELFEIFWGIYPSRTGKIAARASWDKQLGGRKKPPRPAVAPRVIIDGARRYAEDPNRDPEFTKHPTTWLNQGCWDDEPLPPRSRRGTPTQRLSNVLEIGARLQAEQDQREAVASRAHHLRAIEGG